MADLLGATNPVPGYDNSLTNRNIPASPDNTQLQNIPDPSRVVGADGRTERQDTGQFGEQRQIRYDSNFQTFLQQLRESQDLAQSLARLMSKEATVVSSGMSEGIAEEMAKAMELLKMDQSQLLNFLKAQMEAGTRFNGALFALLRNAYARAGSEGVRGDILQFLRSYCDFASSSHLEGNLLRNMAGMANAMPASWGNQLRELLAQLQNSIAAGDRKGSLDLLRQQVFPFMSEYVGQTHDLGTSRGLLSLLTLDVARYENGTQGKLLEDFHQLSGYGTLRELLGSIDDQSLLKLLQNSQFAQNTAAAQFADHLAAAAARALRGEGNAEVQQIFRQLVAAMLVNESVYMPVNHMLIPMEIDGKRLFSELWVDAEAENKKNGKGSGERCMRFLFKIDVQSLGLFDIILTSREREVELLVACPESVANFSQEIETILSQILTRNDLVPAGVSVRKMDRPVTLTEVFPKIFEGKNSINVKV
ncbi:MAG: hypothetical protein HFE99_00115 [Ruminiclostridium sp.]|jgi:hypothetical protein|nr:hypothetical protein [Ruminiclostridium sp.]